MSKKQYGLSAHCVKGKEYSVPYDDFGNKKWGEINWGVEDTDKLIYIQVDEYDEKGVWFNREREMVDGWYKGTKELEIVRRFKDNHPSTEWEYIN